MEKLTFDKNRDHAPLKDDNNGCSYVSMLSSRNPCHDRYQKAVIVCSIVINLFTDITVKSLVHRISRADIVIVAPHCRTCQHLY